MRGVPGPAGLPTREARLQAVQLCRLRGFQWFQVAPEPRQAPVPAGTRLRYARLDQHAQRAQRLGRLGATCCLQLLEGGHRLADLPRLQRARWLLVAAWRSSLGSLGSGAGIASLALGAVTQVQGAGTDAATSRRSPAGHTSSVAASHCCQRAGIHHELQLRAPLDQPLPGWRALHLLPAGAAHLELQVRQALQQPLPGLRAGCPPAAAVRLQGSLCSPSGPCHLPDGVQGGHPRGEERRLPPQRAQHASLLQRQARLQGSGAERGPAGTGGLLPPPRSQVASYSAACTLRAWAGCGSDPAKLDPAQIRLSAAWV